MEIINVGVIGAGTMGNGIAHVFAKTGYNVTLCDLKPEYIDRAIGFISKNLQREVEEPRHGTRRKRGTNTAPTSNSPSPLVIPSNCGREPPS